jgi:hypothetical protein
MSENSAQKSGLTRLLSAKTEGLSASAEAAAAVRLKNARREIGGR